MILSYHTFLKEIIDLFVGGNLQEALTYIKSNRDKVNGIDSQIDNFEFCIAALNGNSELALNIFEKSIQEKGFWYETSQLEGDSDLDSIRDNMKFKALLEMNRRREHEFLGLGQATVHVREGHADKGYIILHGNHENARITKGIWSEEVVDRATSAFLQSGQPDFYDAYHWNDREKAVSDAKSLIDNLMVKYPNVESWTIVGFSMSATVVLDLVTRKLVSPEHIVLFGPWLPYLENEKDKLSVLNHNMKISVLIGDEDEDCREHAEQLVEVLAENELEADFIVMNGTGHGYPDNLKEYIAKLTS